MGRVYVAAAAIAGLGGTLYIALRGTVGGTPMNIGFALYGVLMMGAAVETFRHARARQLAQHRAWAIRLVALAVGSWLYRMDYGLWLKLAHGIGHHSRTFDGPFDAFMAFFFYVPNLAVAEAPIRAGNTAAFAAHAARADAARDHGRSARCASHQALHGVVPGAAYRGPPRSVVRGVAGAARGAPRAPQRSP